MQLRAYDWYQNVTESQATEYHTKSTSVHISRAQPYDFSQY